MQPAGESIALAEGSGEKGKLTELVLRYGTGRDEAQR